jgi:hypothetical protein
MQKGRGLIPSPKRDYSIRANLEKVFFKYTFAGT